MTYNKQFSISYIRAYKVLILQEKQIAYTCRQTQKYIQVFLILMTIRLGASHHRLAILRPIHTYHAVPLACRAAKGLECVFLI